MNAPTCPSCGVAAHASAGRRVCPACLLRIGLEPGLESGVEEDGAETSEGDDSSTRIGPYRLIRMLGEGGMGTVWLAGQSAPVRREVALKLVREGIVSPESLERFELERRVLERLDHPGIARLLDAGQTAEGRPFFVMELVPGVPLTDFCRERKRSVRERIEVFLQVGEAVEYAHQRAVIHRDLKPLNVLVDDEAKPRARVIDFGIAKVLVDPLFDTTALTVAGRHVGTPSYMSPEQAGGAAVDTRSDIYSLGAILFELLTGEMLITRESLQASPPDEIYRRIREEEAERPSARLKHIPKDQQSRRADDFSESFDRWQSQLHGDLDWIVLKTLEKDPARRYKSVGALLDDLHRFLKNEVVAARPPSVTYRVRKFVHRQRSLAASILFAVLVLTAATALSTRWAIRAEKAARLAEDRLAEADAVPTFLFDAFRLPHASPDRSGMLAVEVLDYAAKSAPEEFANQPAIQGRVLEAIGRTYFDLGFYDKASDALSRAEAVTRPVSKKTADLRSRLSQFNSEALRLDRKSDEALEISQRNWREAMDLRGSGSREEIAARQEYAMALITVGNLDLAEKLVEEARGDRERYPEARTGGFEDLHALLAFARGNKIEALAHYERRVEERLGLSETDRDKDFMWHLRYYSGFLEANGKEEDAVRWTELLTRVCEGIYGLRHHLTLEAYSRLARLYRSNEAPVAAWLIYRLHYDGLESSGLTRESLDSLETFSSRIDQETGVAERLHPWLAAVTNAPLSLPDLPPGMEEAEIWFVLAEFRDRAEAFASASGAYRKGLEVAANSPTSRNDDTPRKARYLELLLHEGKLDEVEAELLARLPSFDATDLAERLYLEPLSRLITAYDSSGAVERARALDLQLMSVCAALGARHTGRFLASYQRLLSATLETGKSDDILTFHREALGAVKAKLPSDHPILEMLWLRLAEYHHALDQIGSALATLDEIEAAMDESGRSRNAPIRFNLTLLRCECLSRSGRHDEAGPLLDSLESLIAAIAATPAAGTISEGEAAKWKERIARNRREIVRLRQIAAGAGD